MEESFLAEEKLLKGQTEKPQEWKSNPAKGKERLLVVVVGKEEHLTKGWSKGLKCLRIGKT
jgi:hypothetical protein